MDDIQELGFSDGPVGASEFANTYTLFPDFPDKSERQATDRRRSAAVLPPINILRRVAL